MLMYERQKGVGSTPAGMAEAMSAQESALFAGAAITMGQQTARKAESIGREGILSKND